MAVHSPRPGGTEYRRMVSGQPYRPDDAELVALRLRARSLAFRCNHTIPEAAGVRRALLVELLGSVGLTAEIEPTIHVDYGCNIHLGEGFYANANCVLLDAAEIRIGSDAILRPAVQLLTATHQTDPVERTSGTELGYPITLGDRVWLGGGAIVGPGVTIGSGTVVGSGAVVVQDLPAGVVAVGNPARIIREV